jgi:hypothetical protein
VTYTEQFGPPSLVAADVQATDITETPAYISIKKETDTLDDQSQDALAVTVDGNKMAQLGVTDATLRIGIAPTRTSATVVPQLIVLNVSLVKSRVIFIPQPTPIFAPIGI